MLGRTTSSPQHSDKASSERGARQQLVFIVDNKDFLGKVRNGSKYVGDAISINSDRAPLTDKQKSYVDVLYEKTMKGMGFGSFSPTYKPKRKRC